MEKQEEKKIKVCRRRRSKSSSSSIPLDLASDIFLRLPEKFVARFRCVSKSWSSITTDPYFINMYKSRSPSPTLLLCFKAKDKLFVSSSPQHHQIFETSNNSYSSFEPTDRYHMEVPKYNIFRPTESVQGLICFQKSATPILWNPSTRQKITLTKPSESWNDLRILLGYDPVESKHKVMCVPFARSSDECRVLTLGSAQEESWRTVKTNLNLNTTPADYTSERCINGVVYYIAYVDIGPTYVLMSFDVRSEKFDKIQLPPSNSHDYLLIAYQGRLAFIDKKPNMENGIIRLWILEDAEKQHKWLTKDFLAPLNHPDKISSCHLQRIGFTHTGEFIFIENGFCLLFYDPVRNSFRRFDLKRITDDKSLRNEAYELHVLPNHVESRISL